MENKLTDIINTMTEVFGQGEHYEGSVTWTVEDRDITLYDNTDIHVYGELSEDNRYYLNEIVDIYGLYVKHITYLELEDESEIFF